MNLAANVKLNEKTALVSGPSFDLCMETARSLLQAGATVILAVADIQKAKPVVTEMLKSMPNADLEVRKLDVSSYDAVRKFATEVAEDHPEIHILLTHAGITAESPSATVPHLGHFLMTGLLIESLQAAQPARVIAYGTSPAATHAFAAEFNRRYAKKGVEAFAAQPEAATTVWAATTKQLVGKGGSYLENGAVAPTAAIDTAEAQRLWKMAEECVKIRY